MFDVSNVSFIHMISQIYRHTYPFLVNMYIYIPWSLSHRPTMSHNKHEPKGPRPQNQKRKNIEKGRWKGKEKKFLSMILISNLEQRQARDEVESESLRELPAARRRRSSCHGSVMARSE